MKRLLIFLKGYEKESFLAPLFKMLEATFELIVPLVVARIMDIGIKNQDNVYIWHQCVIMVLLGVIGLACSLTAQYFSAKAAMGFITALRKELFFPYQQAFLQRTGYAWNSYPCDKDHQ